MRPRARIGGDGKLALVGEIGGADAQLDAATVIDNIATLAERGPITVSLTSPGGYVDDALAVHHALATARPPVTVEIPAMAASAASVIAAAGDDVAIARQGLFMLHDPWVIGAGAADDLRDMAAVLDRFADSLIEIYQRKTGLSPDRLRNMMKSETWLSASEAIQLGFADRILASSATGPQESAA